MREQRRAIVTVEGTRAERLWAVPVSRVRGALGVELLGAARTFRDNYEKTGARFRDGEDIHVYGPFASRDLLVPMLDPDAMTLTEEQAHQLVAEPDGRKGAFAHYLLNAAFDVRLPASAGARKE